MTERRLRIVDSHIHLYAGTDLDNLNWAGNLPAKHVLKQQRSVNDYRKATKGEEAWLAGFIFVETDRKYDSKSRDWTHTLKEIAFFSRIAAGNPVAGEGHEAADQHLACAMVPWAPLHGGSQVLIDYLSAVERTCNRSEIFRQIRGFRFLLQNQPPGTMLAPDFVDSMTVLHDRGYVFDLTIDCHSTGTWQVREAVQLAKTLHERGKMPTIVLDHCCKPDLTSDASSVENEEAFQEWENGMTALASISGTFVKLSGLLSELAQDFARTASAEQVVKKIKPWADLILKLFGPKRIMFGSDWPVCTVSRSESDGWLLWCRCVELLLDQWKLQDDERFHIWSETAILAYGLSVRPPSANL